MIWSCAGRIWRGPKYSLGREPTIGEYLKAEYVAGRITLVQCERQLSTLKHALDYPFGCLKYIQRPS